MTIRKICICGGGSLGLVCAGVFLSRGVDVNILTGHPEKWHRDIQVFDKENREYSGRLSMISDKAAEIIPNVDFVFLTLPGYMIQKTLNEIKPYLKEGTIVGSVVSSTGFFFSAHETLGNRYCLMGFQRVPYIARYREYGKVGELLGYKPHLNVCIENNKNPESLRLELERLFATPISLLENFYEASLTNSNPILHTGRLYVMWRNYHGEGYASPTLFYSEWDDDASDIIIRMDEEFQNLLRALGIRPEAIPTLLDYYESSDAKSLTKKIRSITAFKSIMAPMKKDGEKWVPDFNSRYFTEDFPYGLRYIKELAERESISTPVIDMVYQWGMKKAACS